VHDVIDAISLEIAKRVAARLRADHSLIEIARKNLSQWKTRNADSPRLVQQYSEWERILDRPLSEVLENLCAENERGQQLRQNSPFVGVLPDREVRELKRKLRQGEAATA
jgi:hypothetical protein